MSQVQLRVPEETLREIDEWVSEGRFKSRSDAIRTVLSLYQDREKTRKFYEMLIKRSEEAQEDPSILIPLEEMK
jgi:Arc/MetJ-type ribon-helix-helix transcriptional regulator